VSSDRSHDPAAFHDADATFAAQTVRRGDIPFHAASVDIGGSIVAFAGESGSGKSTLCAATVLSGHRFVSDEITAVSATSGLVTPYHRPVGLRAGGSDALGIAFPDDRRSIPSAVHPWPVDVARRSDGGPLTGVFLVRWKPDAGSIIDVEPPQALVELAQHIVLSDDDALDATFRAVEALVRRIPVRRLTYGDPFEGVDLVVREVGSWSN
jgi:hypothetical protein